MRNAWMVLLALAGLATPAAAAPEGDRMVALTPRAAKAAERCTPDRRWCLGLAPAGAEDAPPLPVLRPGGNAGQAPPEPAATEDTEDTEHAPWPRLILLREGGFLAGVLERSSTGYSGGGGSATLLRLYRLSPRGEAAAAALLEVPLEGALMIRACFSEKDERRRRGACHDEYGFSASLTLAPGGAPGWPALRYASEAWGFPRGASRSRDSSERGPLRQADLVRQRDAACSITRVFLPDAGTGGYAPNAPLPDCSDYTVP